MTDIFRRRLFGAAAATGLAAVPAHAARVDADEELLKKDYPAGRRSAALGQPAPSPNPKRGSPARTTSVRPRSTKAK